jgi:DNA-binding IclR family transcriptional regulator
LRRGIEALHCFDERRLVISVREIADEIGAPLASTYRIVRELEALGLLEVASAGQYRLGLALARLGNLALRGRGLRDVAVPVMQELAERAGETALLLVRVGSQAVCIEHVEGTYPIRPRSFGVGEQVDLWAGASALALFAFLPDDEREQVLADRFEPEEIDRVTRVRELCAETRRNGWCLTRDQVVVGTAAVAAPVFRGDGDQVVAALSLTGLTERIVDLEDVITEAARRIGMGLA